MTAFAAQNPFPFFFGLNGLPLSGGRVYFGQVSQDPRSYPVSAYYDEAMTVPVTQPMATTAGYLYRNGAPARVYMASDCSVLALDSAGRQVFYTPNKATQPAPEVATFAVDRFSGTGAQTAFALSVTPQDENNTQVYVSGVYQQKNTYSLAANVLTFAVAPASGTNNVEVTTLGLVDYAAAAATIGAGMQAAAETVALYDAFDDRYLGSKAADPTLDNDGDALLEGAVYWNSVDKYLKTYNGTSWERFAYEAAAVAAIDADVAEVEAAKNVAINTDIPLAIASVAAINSRGAWTATARTYALRDIVTYLGTWYICVVAHSTTVSSDFAVDGPLYWRVYQGITSADLEALNTAVLQNWNAAATEINVRDMGSQTGSTLRLPRTATMSQAGTTVTASTSFFEAGDEGRRIVWANGVEAVIRTVNTSDPTLVTTCTVDRSQTVGSQSATVNPKGVTLVYQGDSIGYEVFKRVLTKLYRAYGFGGLVASPLGDSTGERIQSIALAGGAAEFNGATETVFPQGAGWSVPAGGTLDVGLVPLYTSAGVENPNAFDLAPEERKTDTADIIWQRAAGSITIQRKRVWEKDWETVTTIADTSVGSGTYYTYKAKHTLGQGWVYQVLGVSGTVNVVMVCLWNRTTPGFATWSFQRGSSYVTTANTMTSATLAELVNIINPDLRTYFYADYGQVINAGSTMAIQLAASSALWDAAAPRTDTLWLGVWDASAAGDPTGQNALDREAVRTHALGRGDPYGNMFLPMGSYIKARSIGLNRDTIHQTAKGSGVTAAYFDRVFSFLTSPLAAESRNVNASSGKFKDLYARGRPMLDDLRAVGANAGLKERGAQWLSGTCFLGGTVGSAIGVNDPTLAIKLTVPAAGVTGPTIYVGGSVSGGNSAGHLSCQFVSGALRINLRNAANTSSYAYQISNISNRFAGKTGWLYVVFDRARNCFRVYFDTEFGDANLTSQFTAGTATEDFTTGWTGLGTNLVVQGDSATLTPIFGVAFWPGTQLTEAQVLANVLADRPVGTAPDAYLDFSEQAGRQVMDRSGNARHALFQLTGTNKYQIGAGPTWLYPRRAALASPVSFDSQAAVKLLPNEPGISNHTVLQTCALPDAPQVGDRVRIAGKGVGKWKVGQPALHQVFEGAGGTVGTNATTIGTGGSISGAARYDSIELECVTATPATAYEWTVVARNGAPTWV